MSESPAEIIDRNYNSKTKIAFDVDGTLINPDNTPRYDVINFLNVLDLVNNGFKPVEFIVWSGGGVDYANQWVEKLGLRNQLLNSLRVIAKGSEEVDIAIDDQEVTLGKVNIQV